MSQFRSQLVSQRVVIIFLLLRRRGFIEKKNEVRQITLELLLNQMLAFNLYLYVFTMKIRSIHETPAHMAVLLVIFLVKLHILQLLNLVVYPEVRKNANNNT